MSFENLAVNPPSDNQKEEEEVTTPSPDVALTLSRLDSPYLTDTTSLTIVPYTRSVHGAPLYYVMNRGQGLVGELIVQEGLEIVQFRSRLGNKDNILKTDGGLQRYNDEMIIYGFNDTSADEPFVRNESPKEVARVGTDLGIYVDEKKIFSLEFSTKLLDRKEDFSINILDCSDESSSLIASIVPDGKNVIVLFKTADVVSNLLKGVVLMYLVKAYYTIFMAHRFPYPAQTLSQLPPAASTQLGLDSLKNITSVIFRASSINAHDDRYVEVLRHADRKYCLIMHYEKKSETVVFKDEFGDIQFSYEDSNGCDIHVYDSSKKEVGHFASGQNDKYIFDAVTSYPIMTTERIPCENYVSRSDFIKMKPKDNFILRNVCNVPS